MFVPVPVRLDVAATCLATELYSISVKLGTTASKADTARASVKYRLDESSSTSAVVSPSIASVTFPS